MELIKAIFLGIIVLLIAYGAYRSNDKSNNHHISS